LIPDPVAFVTALWLESISRTLPVTMSPWLLSALTLHVTFVTLE
jgi:hypothetical protein